MRILVVDDDPVSIRLVSAALSRNEHQILTAADSAQALALLFIADIDAVVLDVLMPGITGYELLVIVRNHSRTRQIPGLLLSALGETKDRVRGILLGANDYLAKPFDPEEVVVRVERMAERRATPPGGMVGDLAENRLIDVLQSLEQTTKHGVLHLISPQRNGWLTIKEGQLVSTRYGLLEGPEALYTLLDVQEGFFSFEPLSESETSTLVVDPELHLPSVTLRMAKLRDDLERFQDSVPAVDTPLRASSAPEDRSRVPVPCAEVFERVEALPGVALEELIGQEFLSPLRTRLAAAVLVQRSLLHAGY